jgi:hypothetical protein
MIIVFALAVHELCKRTICDYIKANGIASERKLFVRLLYPGVALFLVYHLSRR